MQSQKNNNKINKEMWTIILLSACIFVFFQIEFKYSDVGKAIALLLPFVKLWHDKKMQEQNRKSDKEIEELKDELEKARNDYDRYSGKKFEILHSTWSSLVEISHKYDEQYIEKIYRDKNVEKVVDFFSVIRKEKIILEKNKIFFKENLYKRIENSLGYLETMKDCILYRLSKKDSNEPKKKLEENENKLIITMLSLHRLSVFIEKNIRREIGFKDEDTSQN